MASNTDWAEDVRRWSFSGRGDGAKNPASAGHAADESEALGYEAADPALQAWHWPDAPSLDPSVLIASRPTPRSGERSGLRHAASHQQST